MIVSTLELLNAVSNRKRSAPPPPVSLSLPSLPSSTFAALLPTMVLFRLLPVPLIAERRTSVVICTLSLLEPGRILPWRTNESSAPSCPLNRL